MNNCWIFPGNSVSCLYIWSSHYHHLQSQLSRDWRYRILNILHLLSVNEPLSTFLTQIHILLNLFLCALLLSYLWGREWQQCQTIRQRLLFWQNYPACWSFLILTYILAEWSYILVDQTYKWGIIVLVFSQELM